MVFAVAYAYNSGKIENDAITMHDTREVFERGGVSSFTGDVRTLFEIENLRVSWNWMLERLVDGGFAFDERELLECHRMLTQGTYDERRWSLGERPGEYKHHAYEVADGVGCEPEDVSEAIAELLGEVREARGRTHDALDSLTIAAYLHAVLVDVHPLRGRQRPDRATAREHAAHVLWSPARARARGGPHGLLRSARRLP